MVFTPVRIIGSKEFRARLMRMEAATRREMRQWNKEAAEPVMDEAKILVPVRSGRLRTTIRTAAGVGFAAIRAGFKSVPYAGPIHFGWPTRPNAEKNWRGGPIRPNPFLYDAADKRIGEVIAKYEEKVAQVIRENNL